MKDRILGYIGIMKKSGRISTGEFGLEQAVNRQKAYLVALASDISANTEEKVRRLAAGIQVPCLRLPYSKELIGAELGKSGCAYFSINDRGFADGLLTKLKETFPDMEAAVSETEALLKSKAATTSTGRKQK